MFDVPAKCFILRRASAESNVVAQPTMRGEVKARVADDSLVCEERNGTSGVVRNEDGDVDVPRLHPRR